MDENLILCNSNGVVEAFGLKELKSVSMGMSEERKGDGNATNMKMSPDEFIEIKKMLQQAKHWKSKFAITRCHDGEYCVCSS